MRVVFMGALILMAVVSCAQEDEASRSSNALPQQGKLPAEQVSAVGVEAPSHSDRADNGPGEPVEALSSQPGVPTPSREESLAVAKKSGCLACHSVDKKLVGPPWRDVAARYREDPAAMGRLVEKVKRGGKGNWTELTGGVAMPPYAPRVSHQEIERLVSFILSLS